MGRIISLTICILFILYLLRNDAKRIPDISWALWIPLLWFLIISTRPVSAWLGVSGAATSAENSYIEGNSFERNIDIAFMIVGMLTLLKRKTSWGNIFKNNKFIFLYVLYLLLSTLWSDYTLVSFKRWIKELGNLIMVLIILTESNPSEAIKTMIKRAAYILMPLSIVFNRFFHEYSRIFSVGGEPMTTGVTDHKNSLGQLCLICGLVLFWNLLILRRNKTEIPEKKEIYIHLLLLAMIGWLLHEAHCATAVGCTIIGVGMIAFLSMSSIRKNPSQIKYYVVIFAIVLIIMHLSFGLKDVVTSGLGRNSTLSGRTDIWDDVLAMKTNPLIGTGFSSFWLGNRLNFFWSKYAFRPRQAHNGYLELYINLGLIGLSLFLGLIITVFKNISQKLLSGQEYDSQILRLTIVILYIAVNFTEANITGFWWFVFLLVAINYSFKASQTKVLEGLHHLQ